MKFGVNEFVCAVSADDVAEAVAVYARSPLGRGPGNIHELREARSRRVVRAVDEAADDRIVETGGRQVSVRIIRPGTGPTKGVHLDIHGGGFYMDTAARGDTRNRQLADSLGVVVVSVDYRLAPEDPWPAAPDDCETAALWLAENTEAEFGSSRLTIGGSSAGATLAMTILIRLRDSGIAHTFTGAALQFGTYDLSGCTPAGRLIADEYFLEAYLGHVADRTLPDISPIYANLRGLPPILMVVGSTDILLEDNVAMACRLSVAGNDVDLLVYPASPHGFTARTSGIAARALTDIESWLDARLRSVRQA